MLPLSRTFVAVALLAAAGCSLQPFRTQPPASTRPATQGGSGPHGLCIGATGSGKSELLRTLRFGLPNGVNWFLEFAAFILLWVRALRPCRLAGICPSNGQISMRTSSVSARTSPKSKSW